MISDMSGSGQLNSRAVAIVTNRWYREQRRADQDATRMLTLLKQRKISCLLKVESLHKDGGPEAEEVDKELKDIEGKMSDLVKDREDRSKRIMDRRVLQVTTLQELGLLEAAGKESKWRSESDLKDRDSQVSTESPSPRLTTAHYSPASSSSSHASRKYSPPLRDARYRGGSDPSITRPDPNDRLQPGQDSDSRQDSHHGKHGLVAKLSPRIGRRNPLRMLSNAIDFRTRRKHRPKSADFDNNEASSEAPSQEPSSSSTRSASVTDILECVSLSPEQIDNPQHSGRPPRILEGRNSAPDMLGDNATLARAARNKSKLSAAANAKQKLSTRFQPQRKVQHRLVAQQNLNSAVKRAQTFSIGGPGQPSDQRSYKTLPKKSSSRSLGSTSTDSSNSSQSTTSSRKSSNSSNISDCSMNSASIEISQSALEEIAAFEKFITEYFENSDNNNTITRKPSQLSAKSNTLAGQNNTKQKMSASSILTDVLELSI